MVSTKRGSSDSRSDVFALGPSPTIAEFARICWGERIRTSDWLIQNQVSAISPRRTNSRTNLMKHGERGTSKPGESHELPGELSSGQTTTGSPALNPSAHPD
jgi:hypothetical protein